MEGKTIVCWFSCGVASAIAAKKTIEFYGDKNTVLVVNNPVKEEDDDNKRFLADVEKWIGQKIIEAKNENAGTISAVDIWKKRKYMSGTKGAPCTTELKKGARYEFEKAVNIDFHVLGFTADEIKRHERFTRYERENVIPVLIDLELTKSDCMDIIKKAGIEPPNAYKMGYPNANCIGCVKATSPTYWNLVRVNHPNVFNERAQLSREIGCKLVRYKGRRIYLDELPADAKGRKIKAPECGIFCQEKTLIN